MDQSRITWDQKVRFRLLEIVLQWEGRLTTNHLCSAFDIGRQQASKDINRYIKEFSPEGLVYDWQLKGYKPTTDFVPQFSQGTVNEYLHLLHQDNPHANTLSLVDHSLADRRYDHTKVLDVPSRHVDSAIVRGLGKPRATNCEWMSIMHRSVPRS